MSVLLFDEEFLTVAGEALKEAKSSVILSSYKAEITHKPRGKKLLDFFETLEKKHQSGVKIFMLLNWNTQKKSVAKTNLYVMTELKKIGIRCRYLNNNRCCHAKIIVIDSTAAFLGSHNLSIKSCSENFEASMMTTDVSLIKNITARFMQLYGEAQEF